MDVDALLQSRGEDAPSGEDLEYDPAFTDLEIAAAPGEERQVGDEIIAAEEPDYKEIATFAQAVLERSHDLRAGVFMAQAQLRLKGLPGFAKTTSYLRGCLETYWDTCHPQLDADDDNDPTMRVNAMLALADSNSILSGLRRAPLTESRMFGMISLRHISVAEGESTPPSDMEAVPDSASIAAAFQDTDPERMAEISAAATQALEDVTAIDAKFSAETPGQGPELDPLIKMLKQINQRIRNAVGGSQEDLVDEDAGEDVEGGVGAPAAAGAGPSGSINNSTDVLNTIDRILAYYERHEPSSPVPILLVRAKKLVNADFLTIMKNMAPAGVERVNLIGGLDDD